MQITVSSRNTEVSEALRVATTQKIGRLGKLVPGADRAEVHFCEERNPRIADREVCEVVLHGTGRPVQCRAAAPDGFAAMNMALSKLHQQLGKARERQRSQLRRR